MNNQGDFLYNRIQDKEQLSQLLIAKNKILKRINKNKELQEIAKLYCKDNLIDWIEDWIWTYDPRLPIKNIPFILYPKQKEYLIWRRERRKLKQHGLFEKSRDSGATWLNCCDHVHSWLFEYNFAGTFASQKESLVDDRGNPKSIFEKIRMILRSLPKWFLPEGFNWAKHDNSMRLINPENGSIISGEIGDNIGRGGRSTIFDWDEVAFAERPTKCEAALSNNTDTIFYTSTVNGHNFFYKKRSQLPPECIFRFHWKDDPRKDENWYKLQCEKFDSIIVASEIDINYGASVEGILIPNQWVLAAIDLDLKEQSSMIVASLDVATSGKCLNVLTIRRGNTVVHIEHWSETDTTQTTFKAIELCRKHKVSVFNFDADGVGAGVAGTINSVGYLPFIVNPLHGASTGSSMYWPVEEKTSKDKFANGRAEWWGILAWRFKNTYDFINEIRDSNFSEMISIPNHNVLIQQISQPTKKWGASGKILVESKDDMKKRGIESPDFADSLAYCFAPTNLGMWDNL